MPLSRKAPTDRGFDRIVGVRPFGVALLCAATVAAAVLAACGSSNSQDTDPSATPGPGPGSEFGGDGGGSSSSPGSNGKPRTCDTTECTAAGGSCSGIVCVVSENPGNLSKDQQTALKAGGKSDTKFAWLYPYDKTVFPRGLLPPTLQFDGDEADAVYVKVSSVGVNYEGFFSSSKPTRVTFSKNVWSAITLAVQGGEDVKVDVSKLAGGKVTGPISETWRIAQGSLAGTIYYETYGSKLVGGTSGWVFGDNNNGVGIMKIEPGATQPTVLKRGCGNVCHTASADGSTLVAATTERTSASYDLKNDAAALQTPNDSRFTFAALTPDGSLAMSTTDPRGYESARMFDTHTGAEVPTQGWDGVAKRTGTPAFSPDGKHFVFVEKDTSAGHTLTLMDFDQPKRAFSNRRDVTTDPKYVGWPAFTPDSKWIVYHSSTNDKFETDQGARGDLFGIELASKQVVRLDAANGYGANGSTYLPANDPQLSFAPTVLPVAVGGYFWAVFTSHRSYGNTLPSLDNNGVNGKLWVAAIDLDAPPGKDPSHPAFYLDGQEADADNLRGFWVLSPCKSNGSDCATGDECCGGFCRDSSGAPKCVPPPTGCSNESEKCASDSDCCVSGSRCINAHCAAAGPK